MHLPYPLLPLLLLYHPLITKLPLSLYHLMRPRIVPLERLLVPLPQVRVVYVHHELTLSRDSLHELRLLLGLGIRVLTCMITEVLKM